MIQKIILAIGILIFTGCGSVSKDLRVTKVDKVEKNLEHQKVETPKNLQPAWINNPDMDGYKGSVGIVKLMQNKKKQNYIAKKLAIASLQERKRVEINSKVITTQKVKNDAQATTRSMQEIRQTSSHFKTNNIIQKAEYSDDENYYVWMVIQK